jgi:hypothetical protein
MPFLCLPIQQQMLMTVWHLMLINAPYLDQKPPDMSSKCINNSVTCSVSLIILDLFVQIKSIYTLQQVAHTLQYFAIAQCAE